MKKNEKLMYTGLGLSLISLVLTAYLDASNDFTEISDAHDRILGTCMYASLATGAIIGLLAWFTSRGTSLVRRTGLICAFSFLGFLCTFMLSSGVVDGVEGETHFPPSKTKTFLTLMQISRAYQTHGKGSHWYIQTQPLWTDLNISEEDYNSMLSHRRPDDSTSNEDEISSKGYFCAKLEVQQSDTAIRIMHAGSHELPPGTVVLCPHR